MIRIRYRSPYDFEGILAFLSARAIPGVETAVDGRYARTGRVSSGGNAHALIVVTDDSRGGALAVRHRGAGSPASFRKRVSHLFDVGHDPERMTADLSPGDPRVPIDPGVRVPGAWEPFELCVRAIIGQQITVAGARTLLGRLADRFGERIDLDSEEGLTTLFPTPESIENAELESIGLTRARSETLREVARLFSDDSALNVCGEPFERTLPRIQSIRGIGPWTIGYVAMRGTGDPDAYPVGDLGLRNAFGPETISIDELSRRAERWRPWRAYVSMALWSSLSGTRSSTSTGATGGRRI